MAVRLGSQQLAEPGPSLLGHLGDLDGLAEQAFHSRAESLQEALPAQRTDDGRLEGFEDLGGQVVQEVAVQVELDRVPAVLGRGGPDAVAALMRTYRAYVVDHPRRYAAMPGDPLHDPALVAAGTKLLTVPMAVLRAYGLRDSAAVHATRCLRAIVHGFASIEAAGGFGLPEDLDETYEQLIAMFTASLPSA